MIDMMTMTERLRAAGYRRCTWGPDHWCDWIWQSDVLDPDGKASGSVWECRNCENRVQNDPAHFSPGSVVNGELECPAYAVLAVSFT